MQLKKFTSIGLVAALTAIVQPVFAAANEDFAPPQGACMIMVSDTDTSRMINVEYIRLIQVKKEKPTIVSIYMASNYYSGGTELITMNYLTSDNAKKALQDLSNKVNDCQYEVAKRRNVKNNEIQSEIRKNKY